MRIAAITDIGTFRKRNEDQYWIDKARGIFAVCDGMGGHKGGDVASHLVVQTLQDYLAFTDRENIIPALLDTVQLANRLVYEQGHANQDLHDMGTTLTAAVVQEGKMIVAHVGDSSLFVYQDGRLNKITRDHTLAEQMLADGLIQPSDLPASAYNHVLTRAVGVDPQVDVDIYQAEVESGDWILVCSDGLTDLVSEEEIAQHLSTARSPQETAQALIDSALGQGGYDNITVVLVSI